MKNIYVVTHTQSIHHVERKVGGWYDTGLTATGQQQAQKVVKRLAQLLEGNRPNITSSDLLRAQETAEIISNDLGCEYELHAGLREISYGVAEGRPQAWLNERMVAAPDSNRLDHISIDGGESKAVFIDRVYKAVDDILSDDNPNQIIVTHGFALTFVVSRWIGLPAESAGLVNFRGSAGGITHLQQDEYWRNRGVRQLNEIAHLST